MRLVVHELSFTAALFPVSRELERVLRAERFRDYLGLTAGDLASFLQGPTSLSRGGG